VVVLNIAFGGVDDIHGGADESFRVFLQGYSYGAIASLFAVDPKTPGMHDAKIAGLIAYYPDCYDNVDPSVPTLALIGEKDDWTPAAACQKVSGKPNFEVAVIRTRPMGSSRP
jgi:dienelactone hydrolase